jgi:hypothetical protein
MMYLSLLGANILTFLQITPSSFCSLFYQNPRFVPAQQLGKKITWQFVYVAIEMREWKHIFISVHRGQRLFLYGFLEGCEKGVVLEKWWGLVGERERRAISRV